MFRLQPSIRPIGRFSLAAIAILGCTGVALIAIPALSQEAPQQNSCPTLAARDPSPAEGAYAQGKYAQAEDLLTP